MLLYATSLEKRCSVDVPVVEYANISQRHTSYLGIPNCDERACQKRAKVSGVIIKLLLSLNDRTYTPSGFRLGCYTDVGAGKKHKKHKLYQWWRWQDRTLARPASNTNNMQAKLDYIRGQVLKKKDHYRCVIVGTLPLCLSDLLLKLFAEVIVSSSSAQPSNRLPISKLFV